MCERRQEIKREHRQRRAEAQTRGGDRWKRKMEGGKTNRESTHCTVEPRWLLWLHNKISCLLRRLHATVGLSESLSAVLKQASHLFDMQPVFARMCVKHRTDMSALLPNTSCACKYRISMNTVSACYPPVSPALFSRWWHSCPPSCQSC